MLGVGHSVAYALGCAVLLVGLARRVGGSVWPTAIAPIAAMSALVGGAAWVAVDLLLDEPASRVLDAAVVTAAVAGGGAVLAAAYRASGLSRRLTARLAPAPAAVPPPDPGAPPEVLA